MKLGKKHLAPYLPYNLEVLIDNGKSKTIANISENGFDRHFLYALECGNVKILDLRPLSDLTKEIEVNGERFVPLVRLFASSNGSYQSEYKYINKMSTFEIQIEMLGHRNYYFSLMKDENVDVRIDNTLRFNCYSTDLTMNDRKDEIVKCPYYLLEKLHEWHFDTFNLIPNNLAIDINTL